MGKRRATRESLRQPLPRANPLLWQRLPRPGSFRAAVQSWLVLPHYFGAPIEVPARVNLNIEHYIKRVVYGSSAGVAQRVR